MQCLLFRANPELSNVTLIDLIVVVVLGFTTILLASFAMNLIEMVYIMLFHLPTRASVQEAIHTYSIPWCLFSAEHTDGEE